MTTFETNALEINDLNKNYPGFSLNHLNLTLPSGCILGPVSYTHLDVYKRQLLRCLIAAALLSSGL